MIVAVVVGRLVGWLVVKKMELTAAAGASHCCAACLLLAADLSIVVYWLDCMNCVR